MSHGFIKGANNITITKVQKWKNERDINWKAFLWYISDYAEILDFGERWFKVTLLSDSQINFFYHKVLEYDEKTCEEVYSKDLSNELWKSNKKGTKLNMDILTKLADAELNK